ncbi:MAG: hypothetical protein ABI760_15785, partial [Ferruginibacter sp.]
MANCSEYRNPLQHNGASQAQRLLPGLDKNKFALVDEKRFADWIVFANDFAAFINYYGFKNAVAGNWQQFFSSDISAQLGAIAIQNIVLPCKTELRLPPTVSAAGPIGIGLASGAGQVADLTGRAAAIR